VVVVGSATSGVSGWAIWSWGYGQHIWLAIAAMATLLAAPKPVLQINKKIELYGKLLGGHRANYLAAQALGRVFNWCSGESSLPQLGTIRRGVGVADSGAVNSSIPRRSA